MQMFKVESEKMNKCVKYICDKLNKNSLKILIIVGFLLIELEFLNTFDGIKVDKYEKLFYPH